MEQKIKKELFIAFIIIVCGLTAVFLIALILSLF